MGRKIMNKETAIVVDVDGELVAWVNGKLVGNMELLENIHLAASLGRTIDITPMGPTVEANLEDATDLLGVLAALMFAKPGRVRILELPEEVTKFLPQPTPTNEEVK